ncbi:MAG TPA: ABC transporter substrate-binding protein [Kofleriaceae bacterium]|jgi:trehalose/maltose transport system substrate-binding protein|nr:ABC transporter substrate-binding protein [Kofleriaceae bacterium]
MKTYASMTTSGAIKTCLVMCLLTLLSTGACNKGDKDKGKGAGTGMASNPTEGSAMTPPATPAAGATELTISCGSVGLDYDSCKEGVEAWQKKSGHTAKVVAGPTSATEVLALYQQLLAASASDIDVLRIDVVWPGILGNFLLDLKPYSKGAEKDHFESIIANNTIDGHLVAMPWYTDAGLLYYRKDLLEKYGEAPPTTWDQFNKAAKKIQDAERKAGQKDLWGFVFQGKAYEGLTCNALEWVASYGGGNIVEPDGKISIDNPQAAAALTMAASWVGTISPPGVLNYEEEEARGLFQSGNAVFMRNWPYAWALAQGADSPVKGKVGVITLPKAEGGRNAAALGGWNLAVSKFSKHPEAAADLVMYLTSFEEEKRRAIQHSYQPTIPRVYEDKDVLGPNPFFANLVEVFKSSVPRPSTVTGGKYNQVSSAFWNAVHAVLSKEKPAKDSLTDLASNLERLGKGGKW